MNPVEFEKDDDTNSHIDFISTAAVSTMRERERERQRQRQRDRENDTYT